MLNTVEVAILRIFETHPDREIRARELRGLLANQGFRRTAPAFVFTMMRLEDKGCVSCREEIKTIDGIEQTDRYYLNKVKPRSQGTNPIR